MGFTHAVVLDFEATCDEPTTPRPQEVIEFPSVLLELGGGVVDTFERFVRPVHHPQLSAFCRQLTSITQAQVDAAPPFPVVLAEHRAWLQGHGLDERNALIVTCGDWDLQRMLPAQVATSGVSDIPAVLTRWLNLKVPFQQRFGTSAGMKGMLDALGLPLVGRHHRGIDDCHNITTVLKRLLELGAVLEPTGQWTLRAWPPLPLVLEHRGVRTEVVLRPRSYDALWGLARKVVRGRVVEIELEGRGLQAGQVRDLPAGTVLVVVDDAEVSR